mgnify:CR=1 FL=1
MKKLIAKDLLSIAAVFLRPEQPFTWASGIKSPIYCDNRLTLTAPEVRTDVENGIVEIIKAEYPEAEVLMGTSTAGIAHAAISAHIMGMPMGYVRSGAKDHGRQNQIEGKLEKGQKVVVVEDLISTGGSCIDVVNVLREAGAEYGAKTGRPRRVGPIDIVATRYNAGGIKALDFAVPFSAESDHRGFQNCRYLAAEAAIENLEYGDYVTEPEPPTREGYVFCGWYSDENCIYIWDFETMTVPHSLMLYAKWEPAAK